MSEPVYLLVLALLLLALGLNYARFRDPLYPPVFHAGLWLGVLLVYFLNRESYNELSGKALFVIANGVCMFALGAYFATYGHQVPAPSSRPVVAVHSSLYSNILFWLPIFGLPVFLYKAYQFGASGPFDSFFMNMRFALSGELVQETYGPIAYLVTVSAVAAGLELLIHVGRRNRLKLGVSVAVALIYAVFSTGRTYLFFLAATLLGILFITRRMTVRRGLLYLSAIGTVAFVGLGLVYGKGMVEGGDLSDISRQVYELTRTYLLGSLPAFDLHMATYPTIDLGSNAFRTVLAVLERIGYDVTAPPLIKDYQYVPVPTNVYTVYQPYFSDFWFPGILFIQLILGAGHGLLYRKAIEARPFYVYVYAVFLFPLFMQFFQDMYFSLLSTWIQVTLLAGLQFCRVRLPRRTFAPG